MTQTIAILLVLLCAAGYLMLIARGRRSGRSSLPLLTLGLLVASASLLTLNVVQVQRPVGELRIYFSLSDFAVIGRISGCLETPTSDCPQVLRQRADRVVAVVSQSAVGSFQRSVPAGLFDVIRGLEKPDLPGGLTLEDGLAEINAETEGGISSEGAYVFVTPRVRSAAAARAAYQRLLRQEATLEKQIVLVGEEALGIGKNRIVPVIELEAPAVVSSDSNEYEVRLTVTNLTNASVDIEGLQVVNTPAGASVHRLKIKQNSISPFGTAEDVDPLVVPTDRHVIASGRFATAGMNSVTSLNIVARNQYGETLTQQVALTRVEEPVLGFLRMGTATSNDFRRFADSSGIDAEDVTLDLSSLETVEGREGRLQAMASALAEWGMIVVAEPLTAVQGELLLEVLSHTPAGITPPSLLFAGGGDSSTLYKNFTDERMAGWQRFLGPMGIVDISGTRKIYVAVDQSGSLSGHQSDVAAAIETLFHPLNGFGGRNANLLVAFCGAPERQEHACSKDDLVSQVNQGLGGSSWEGADHLVSLDTFGQNEAKKFFSPPSDFRDVTDFVLFWDGDDISGRFGGPAALMPTVALQALGRLEKQGVRVHVATFDSAVADPNVKKLEELSKFSGENSTETFRNTVVKNVIARGLTVTAGDTDGLPDLVKRRVERVAENNVQVINSLFPPNALPGLMNQGTRILFKVLHPSLYEAPLLAISDALQFNVAGRPVTLKVGYLGIDLASEFAAIKIDGEQERRQAVSDVVYASVDAMGARLKNPTVSWKIVDGRRLSAQRNDFMPFQLKDGLEAKIRKLSSDGTPASDAVQHAIWDEVSLERMSIDLKGTQLDPGELYVMELSFCHAEATSAADAECLRADLKAPILGSFPSLMESSDWDPRGTQRNVRPDQRNDFPITEPIAQLAFAIMALAVATGVFLL
ncbi:hypothetical protein [Ensifer adhaerens]|uniref:hypothetical protein n=1 Tax=Ensifer adhaerens TaxID=106592 RepID=UPI001C4DE7C6|nr:hypothetical protein [Ensifer adhaerens]MBW0365837.1 hypothetical protein [Ensifer adhaerens]UCM20258.1 hypothetical protein LDL63_01230 [Ensifer adhaerens]